MAAVPALELIGIRKTYGALRPLKIRSLVVSRGERVAIRGVDAAGAELLINLITGATLPDEGEVRVLGQSTATLANEEAWLAWIDQFGILSPRAVLLEGLTVAQNVAMPFTLDIDPVPADIATRVARLASDAGLPDAALNARLDGLPPDAKARVHLARALALDPKILLLEHPTRLSGQEAAGRFAGDVARVARARELTVLAMTEDREFASRVADRWLRLDGATGELRPAGGWRRWLS